MNTELRGIGMTSARTRERLISRLREAGIEDERVLLDPRTVLPEQDDQLLEVVAHALGKG